MVPSVNVAAQARRSELLNHQHIGYAGAYWRNGFHEDGLKAGLQAARALIDAHGLAPTASKAQRLQQSLPGVFA